MKIIKEYIILEKFTDEDSDPIHDLNIGIIRDIKEYVNKFFGLSYTDWVGMSICVNNNKYDFIDFYINSDNIGDDVKLYGLRQAIFYNKLRIVKMFLKAGLKIKDALSPEHVLDLRRFYNLSDKLSKIVNDEFPGKLDVNEKFTEDSDPINDLEIGIEKIINTCIKKINEFDNAHTEFEYLSQSSADSIWTRVHGGIIRVINVKSEAGIFTIGYFSNKFRDLKYKELVDKVKYSKKALQHAGILDLMENKTKIIRNISGEIFKNPDEFTCTEVEFKIIESAKHFFEKIEGDNWSI